MNKKGAVATKKEHLFRGLSFCRRKRKPRKTAEVVGVAETPDARGVARNEEKKTFPRRLRPSTFFFPERIQGHLRNGVDRSCVTACIPKHSLVAGSPHGERRPE